MYLDDMIENISESILEEYILKHFMLKKNKIIKGNYDFFIKFLKEEHFITRVICSDRHNKGEVFLVKLLNIFNLNGIDLDTIFKDIKINGSCVFSRISDWEINEMPLYDTTSKNGIIKCLSSKFMYSNKWGYKDTIGPFKIMFYNDKITWFTNINSYNEPQFFAISKNKIYGLYYEHSKLIIYRYLINTLSEINYIDYDDIINQHRSTRFNHKKTVIDLNGYFDKRFFGLGKQFNEESKCKISHIKEINSENGYLKVIIENLSHPHSGFIILDLKGSRIIKSERIKGE